MTQRAVFLDRDGTLIEEAGYINRFEQLQFYPFSREMVRLLNRAGFRVIVVTNQAGVARGYCDEAFVQRAHEYLDEQIRLGGGVVDGYYYCPHHPEANVEEYRRTCGCRKPAPGMFLQAAREHDIDLARSFAVGDRWHDVEAAQRAGVTAVLVRTGYGASETEKPKADVTAAHVADTLIDATTWILRQPGC